MRGSWLRALAGATALALAGAAARPPASHRFGTIALDVTRMPYIAGSSIPIGLRRSSDSYALSVIGPGSIAAHDYLAPAATMPFEATIVATSASAVGMAALRIVPPPEAAAPLIAVATYDDGIVLHDPRTFAVVGVVPTHGAPGGVAFERDGTIDAPITTGDSLVSIARAPWRIRRVAGVAFGNEVLEDPALRAVFVSDRDAGGGYGALTRIAGRKIRTTRTGMTAEGLALDPQRQIVYVGNVNDASVAAVDARTMRILRRYRSVPRTFGLALDTAAQRLFVASNTSPSMRDGGGYVAAIDVGSPQGRIVARSARMTLPLGIAFDPRTHSVFVTDEGANLVYVLDARTLRATHAPLRTCSTPWLPHFDARSNRLYVPCARANEVDVFNVATLTRVRGAPFRTGGFPLDVAVGN
ncbi:MAG: YncE family protein [Vulcanimicrobiaceae bacterium]